MKNKDQIADLRRRIERLESVNLVRNCLNQYMHICDCLDEDTDLDELMTLFDDKAIWEGIGEKYSKLLGCHKGKKQIRKMFQSYIDNGGHFKLNAHLTVSEKIVLNKNSAKGSWLMIQASSFQNGKNLLNVAELIVWFKKHSDKSWKIKHFTTRNILSKAVESWNDESDFLAPKKKEFKYE